MLIIFLVVWCRSQDVGNNMFSKLSQKNKFRGYKMSSLTYCPLPITTRKKEKKKERAISLLL